MDRVLERSTTMMWTAGDMKTTYLTAGAVGFSYTTASTQRMLESSANVREERRGGREGGREGEREGEREGGREGGSE